MVAITLTGVVDITTLMLPGCSFLLLLWSSRCDKHAILLVTFYLLTFVAYIYR